MRRLILLRHAKSDWSQGSADRDRALAPRGRRTAGPMGAWLADNGLRPDLVLCSPARRAQETWALARAAFAPPPETRFEEAIYEASSETLLGLARVVDGAVATALIVGHNPGLERFAALLAAEGDAEARRAMGGQYPTAAVAVLEAPRGGWAELGPATCRLARFVTPRSLGLGAE